jgi:hypothetical protein
MKHKPLPVRYSVYDALIRLHRRRGDNVGTLSSLIQCGGRVALLALCKQGDTSLIDLVADKWVRGPCVPRGTPWAVRLNRSENKPCAPTYVVEAGFYESYPESELVYFCPSSQSIEIVPPSPRWLAEHGGSL